MKKLVTLFLTMVLVSALSVSALAAEIQVDGKPVEDAQAVTMVPVRAVGEALGFTVTWDGSLPGARVDNGQAHINAVIGVDQYQLTSNNALGLSAPFSLGAAPAMLEEGTLYVPAGLFGVLLGNREDAVVVDPDGTVSITSSVSDEQQANSLVGGLQVINPLHPHDSLESLEDAVGFAVPLPTAPAGYTVSLYQDLAGSIAEVRFSDGSHEISYRISKGTEDNSGDYNFYSETGTMTVDSVSVQCRGKNSLVYVASWTQDSYTFSLRATAGLTVPQVRQMVESVV